MRELTSVDENEITTYKSEGRKTYSKVERNM